MNVSLSLPTCAVELAHFERNLENWLPEHEGQHVVLRGEQVLGFFDDEFAAYRQTVRDHGRATPFLIQQVAREEPVLAVVPQIQIEAMARIA